MGAVYSQPAQALPVTATIEKPRGRAPGLPHQPGKRLTQLHPVAPRQPVQPFGGAKQQMAVGRVRYSLGLNGRVHGDPRQLPLAYCAGLHRHRERLGQQELHLVGPDPLVPARHRRSVERQPEPEMRHAAEGLEIRIFHSNRTEFLVREPLHVLDKMQPDHEPGAQATPTFVVVVIPTERIVEAIPVDQFGQTDQFVLGVEDRLQRGAEQIVARWLGLLRAHGFPRHRLLSPAAQHNPRRTGIPLAHARTKSQGFHRKSRATISSGFGRLFAILGPPFPKHRGGPDQLGRLNLGVVSNFRVEESLAISLKEWHSSSEPLVHWVSLATAYSWRFYEFAPFERTIPINREGTSHGVIQQSPQHRSRWCEST